MDRSGRKLPFLNPVAIRLILGWWINKHRERGVSALAELTAELEEGRKAGPETGFPAPDVPVDGEEDPHPENPGRSRERWWTLPGSQEPMAQLGDVQEIGNIGCAFTHCRA